MTTELEKHKMERIYKHFGFTVENIQSQKQVLKDIHDILIELGASKAQSPDCVTISTKNNTHKIINYPFNITPNYWGRYEHCFCLKVKTDYKIEELRELVKHQVQATFEGE